MSHKLDCLRGILRGWSFAGPSMIARKIELADAEKATLPADSQEAAEALIEPLRSALAKERAERK